MKLIPIMCLLMFVSCPGQVKTQSDKIKDTSFKSYIQSFKREMLPLTLNRKGVFELSQIIYDTIDMTYKANTYPEFTKEFSVFLPEEIKGNEPFHSFRCLFVLPTMKEIIPVIIANDCFQDNEQNELRLFLVTYYSTGEISDFLELAGYIIDFSEQFAEIRKDYSINTFHYQFKDAPEINSRNLFYLLETKKIYKISDNGKFLNVQEEAREGFFDGNWTGYIFVK